MLVKVKLAKGKLMEHHSKCLWKPCVSRKINQMKMSVLMNKNSKGRFLILYKGEISCPQGSLDPKKP